MVNKLPAPHPSVLCRQTEPTAVIPSSHRFVLRPRNSQSLARAMREVLTARESSIGSSGGTTEVRIKVHSRKSL